MTNVKRLQDLPAGRVEGGWNVTLREPDASLMFSGSAPADTRYVYLFFRERLLGIGATDDDGQFGFRLQGAERGFPPGAAFQLATDEGILAHRSGDLSWPVFDYLITDSAGFLDLDEAIDFDKRLTKKGTLASRRLPVAVKESYCRFFARLDEWFEERLGRPLMACHGTLLGLYREGDLPPYDDDFDCLYLSSHDDISAVIDERLDLAIGLLRAGFKCWLGRTGHLKVRSRDVAIDLMPAWIENDVLHISSYSQIPGASEFVLPPSAVNWHVHGRFRTFARPEVFLEAQYGPNWRKPDPGYRVSVSRTGLRNRKMLRPSPEALATLRDVREARRPRKAAKEQ